MKNNGHNLYKNLIKKLLININNNHNNDKVQIHILLLPCQESSRNKKGD